MKRRRMLWSKVWRQRAL